jgi:hypothetical protein
MSDDESDDDKWEVRPDPVAVVCFSDGRCSLRTFQIHRTGNCRTSHFPCDGGTSNSVMAPVAEVQLLAGRPNLCAVTRVWACRCPL